MVWFQQPQAQPLEKPARGERACAPSRLAGKSFKATTLLATAVLGLGGCAATMPTRQISSAYGVFDIQAGPEVGPARIVEAIKRAMQTNTTQVRVRVRVRVQIINGLPPSPLPASASRF